MRSYRVGDKPFSAEIYLRNSTGPFAPYFRGLVPDVNGLAKLDPERIEKSWREEVTQIADHFGFNEEQRARAGEEANKAREFAVIWFQNPEIHQKRQKYYDELRGVQKVERKFGALSFEGERAWAKRKDLDVDRRELTREIDARDVALRESVLKIATPEQRTSAGVFTPPMTTLEIMNKVVTYSVTLIGFCLLMGLLSRLSALGAAVFLLNIYFCIPPWPGLPESPKWEGHYFVVDKNMVEAIACLALVFLPTGQWIGLDALLFGRRRRRLDHPE